MTVPLPGVRGGTTTPARPSPAPLSSVVQPRPCRGPCSRGLMLRVWGAAQAHLGAKGSCCTEPSLRLCVGVPGRAVPTHQALLCVSPFHGRTHTSWICPAPCQAQPRLCQAWAGKAVLSVVRTPWTVARTGVTCWLEPWQLGKHHREGSRQSQAGLLRGPHRGSRTTSQATP